MGRALIIIGLGIALIGAIVWAMGTWFPAVKLGRLPGDIVIERDDLHVYVPITTMILASLLLSAIAWIVNVVQR